MTRSTKYILTAVAAGLWVFLTWAFSDDMWSLDRLWDNESFPDSTLITYFLLIVIIGAGIYQARKLPESDIVYSGGPQPTGQVEEPYVWKMLMGNVQLAVLWLPIRFFLGREWVSAGWHKITDAAWTEGGQALLGYLTAAVAIPEAPARPRITYDWYREFLQFMIDNEWYTWFASVVAWGEFLVGLGLIVGAFVGIAAFFGTLLNFNFLLAGTTSTNPVLFGLGVLVVMGWKVAGHLGLDRFLLPIFGVPWARDNRTRSHRTE